MSPSMEVTAARQAIESYLQSDAASRAATFDVFVRALKILAGAGELAAAEQYARRAIAPALDYSSLRALRRFLPAGPDGDGAVLRLAILGGPTTHQLADLFGMFLAARDVAVALYECEYGLFRQEILTPGSGLDRFQPQVVFLATGARDVARMPAPAMDPAAVAALAEAELGDWITLWETVRNRWNASVIQNTFEVGPWDPLGHFASRHAAARGNYLERLNRAFGERAAAHVVLHNLQSLVVETGANEWFDPRFYLHAKMPCGPECLVSYAHSAASLVAALAGKSRKVLALDLDNTLWGGVVGEVGVEGLQVGQGSAEGEAFVRTQEYARALYERGILLAVCSKNDEAVARRAFELRPDMPLRLDHFACFVANWRNKADNLRDIATRLELGVDSLVFVDDNPAERALVRRLAPEVAVPDLPADPAGYVEAIARHRYFETVAWTAEDASRGRYYAENARRRELAAGCEDVESFLASLDMRACVEPVSALNIDRVTQLLNKSNQFNLTTRRRTSSEIAAIAADPSWRTVAVSLSDKLGDNGLISVVFLRETGGAYGIDTWLMSCRVLQRGVEQLVLERLVEHCRRRGFSELRGTYIPTDRNALVRDHYERLGFEPAGEEGGATFWLLRVDHFRPQGHHIILDCEPEYA